MGAGVEGQAVRGGGGWGLHRVPVWGKTAGWLVQFFRSLPPLPQARSANTSHVPSAPPCFLTQEFLSTGLSSSPAICKAWIPQAPPALRPPHPRATSEGPAAFLVGCSSRAQLSNMDQPLRGKA